VKPRLLDLFPHQRMTDPEFAYVVQVAGSDWVARNYPDVGVAEVLALDRVRSDRSLPAPHDVEPVRARTLRLLGVEWIHEPPPGTNVELITPPENAIPSAAYRRTA
jgi:hypothetical protein